MSFVVEVLLPEPRDFAWSESAAESLVGHRFKHTVEGEDVGEGEVVAARYVPGRGIELTVTAPDVVEGMVGGRMDVVRLSDGRTRDVSVGFRRA